MKVINKKERKIKGLVRDTVTSWMYMSILHRHDKPGRVIERIKGYHQDADLLKELTSEDFNDVREDDFQVKFAGAGKTQDEILLEEFKKKCGDKF